MNRKFLAVCLIFLISFPGIAMAYHRVPTKAFGWSVFKTGEGFSVFHLGRLLGGLDNTKCSTSSPYTFSETVSQSWSKGGSLSASISGGASGLGAEIGGSISWNFEASYSNTQTYGPVNVPPYTALSIYGDFYGNHTNGLAKYFIAWIETQAGSYSVNSMEAVILRPVWQYGDYEPDSDDETY